MKTPGRHIGKVTLSTLALYMLLFGAYVPEDFGHVLVDSSIVLSQAFVGGPHPVWVLDWWKLAAVTVAILLYSVGVVSWTGGRLRPGALALLSAWVFSLSVVGVTILLWPEISFAFGHGRTSETGFAVARFLLVYPAGMMGEIVSAVLIQSAIIVTLFQWLRRETDPT